MVKTRQKKEFYRLRFVYIFKRIYIDVSLLCTHQNQIYSNVYKNNGLSVEEKLHDILVYYCLCKTFLNHFSCPYIPESRIPDFKLLSTGTYMQIYEKVGEKNRAPTLTFASYWDRFWPFEVMFSEGYFSEALHNIGRRVDKRRYKLQELTESR